MDFSILKLLKRLIYAPSKFTLCQSDNRIFCNNNGMETVFFEYSLLCVCNFAMAALARSYISNVVYSIVRY